ncbi:MAG: hypothetical protein AB7I38_18340 [Dehalococcoidia bacterium]
MVNVSVSELIRSLATVGLLVAGVAVVGGQAPTVDTSTIGPQVGSVVPAFSGVDQFGKPQTLESLSGPKGLMLVFNRSADW